MLFDLQSPGRRRIIKVVYSILAILLAVGLVGFGIGSDATGGISDIFSSGGSADTGFEDEIDDAEEKAEANPKDAAAQLELVTLYIQQGDSQLDADEATGQTIVTSDAADSYNAAADAWAAYLALKPPKPDNGAALRIANTFFLLAQNSTSAVEARVQIENAAEAQQVAADARFLTRQPRQPRALPLLRRQVRRGRPGHGPVGREDAQGRAGGRPQAARADQDPGRGLREAGREGEEAGSAGRGREPARRRRRSSRRRLRRRRRLAGHPLNSPPQFPGR